MLISGLNVKPIDMLVPLTGIEPVRRVRARDFKSLVSANSTTATSLFIKSFIYNTIFLLSCQVIFYP